MSTFFDLDLLKPRDRYKLLTASVIPRPVAWITSVDLSGVVNAAPYSFFNIFGQDPALVILGLEHRSDGSAKDTECNIEATGEFVVNIATPSLVESMVGTAATYASGESETTALGLELVRSKKVLPPRLAVSPVSIECVRMFVLSLSSERSILIGRAVGIVARDGLIDQETLRINWSGELPIARLYADRYARLEEIKRWSIPNLSQNNMSSEK